MRTPPSTDRIDHTRRARRRLASVAAVAAVVVIAASCSTGDGKTLRPPTAPPPTVTAPPEDPVTFPTAAPDVTEAPPTLPAEDVFELFAPWRSGGTIDARYGCDGPDVSPALAWVGVPDGTVELAVSAIDETAEGDIHWLVVGVDPVATSSPEGGVPAGAVVFANSFDERAWTGPCPPEGTSATIRIAVHALAGPIDGLDDLSPDELLAEIGALEIGRAETVGLATR